MKAITVHRLRSTSFFEEKNDLKHLGKGFLTQKLLKVTISQTKNHREKFMYAKNERQVNSNLRCKFGHF